MANNIDIDTAGVEATETQGGFLGFVLLKEAKWDKQAFLMQLQEDWGLSLSEDSDDDSNTFCVEKDGMILAVSLVDVPVPGGEAEHYASANYRWQEAVEVTKSHRAQLLVSVLGQEVDAITRGILFSSLVATALADDNALAVYTDGMVYQPSFYRGVVADAFQEEGLPIFAWVWFGVGQESDGQQGLYTYGMSKFGKVDMEVYSDRDLSEVLEMLYNISHYVIASDVVLHDGETIGLTEEQKLAITLSPAINLNGDTLKIAY